jgi:DNA-binding NarL/FixJ family response regulator
MAVRRVPSPLVTSVLQHPSFTRSNAAIVEVEITKTIVVAVKGRLFRDAIHFFLKAPDRTIITNFENLADIPSDLQQKYSIPHLFVISAKSCEELTALLIDINRLREGAPTAIWLLLSQRSDAAFVQQARACGLDWLLPEDASAEVLELLTTLILHGARSAPTPLKTPHSEAGPTRLASLPMDGGSQPPLDGMRPTVDLHAVERRALRCDEDNVSRARAASMREPVDGASLQTRQADLSDRENEILGCLVSGMPNKQIARKLSIAEATVKVHIKGLLRKLRVSNRTQAAILALNILAENTQHILAETTQLEMERDQE